MRTLTAGSAYGHSGQYVARITGRDSRYTFQREFVGRKLGKRGETTEADVDEPGLYEVCDVNKHGRKESRYMVLLDCPDLEILPDTHQGTERLVSVDKADAMKIATALGAGRAIEEIIAFDIERGDGNPHYTYSLLSAREAEKRQTAQTVESATARCWEVLQTLPTKDAKRVLAALKARLIPAPAPAPAAAEAPGE